MPVNYRKLMDDEAEEERAQFEEDTGEPAAGGEEPADVLVPVIPAPSTEAEASAEVEQYRPQPFTPDLIPVPMEVDAHGDLTPQEIDELGHCEAALLNSSQAEWMKWMSAHSIRSRRLYRRDGRTWPQYCEDKFGDSESEVNRRIQQWPLLKAITAQQNGPRSIPDSHVQTLLPLVGLRGEDVTARAYVTLRAWAAENKERVTADVVDGLVELVKASEALELTADNFRLAIEAKPKPKPQRKPRRRAAAPEVPSADGEKTGQEQDGPGATGHPNLGDPPADGERQEAAGGEAEPEEVLDAEIVEDHEVRAAGTLAQLEGMRDGIVHMNMFHGVSTDTLKAIASAARSIADAAEQAVGKP